MWENGQEIDSAEFVDHVVKGEGCGSGKSYQIILFLGKICFDAFFWWIWNHLRTKGAHILQQKQFLILLVTFGIEMNLCFSILPSETDF